MRGVLKPFLDLILYQGAHAVSRGSCCIKGLMLYQRSRNLQGDQMSIEMVSVLRGLQTLYRLDLDNTDIKIYEPILSATVGTTANISNLIPMGNGSFHAR